METKVSDMEENEDQVRNSPVRTEPEQEQQQLSKNQFKKLKKREKWMSIKQEKRRESKVKRKRKLAEMREKGEELGPTRKSLKSNTMRGSSCNIKVVIDLSLDDYMSEKDVNSLTCQLQHSYSSNRRAANPMQLYLCGLCGKTKKRLDAIGDYKGWDVYTEERSYEEIFPKQSLVYLSSESPNILTTLEGDKVYVIGGLVDHNKHKGLCLELAEKKGIAHAQLPISEFLDMKTRKVLAVNHVCSILLRYTESQDWKAAFMAEMPTRKQAQAKGENQESCGSTSNNSDSNNDKSSHIKATHSSSKTMDDPTDTEIDSGDKGGNLQDTESDDAGNRPVNEVTECSDLNNKTQSISQMNSSDSISEQSSGNVEGRTLPDLMSHDVEPEQQNVQSSLGGDPQQVHDNKIKCADSSEAGSVGPVYQQ